MLTTLCLIGLQSIVAFEPHHHRLMQRDEDDGRRMSEIIPCIDNLVSLQDETCIVTWLQDWADVDVNAVNLDDLDVSSVSGWTGVRWGTEMLKCLDELDDTGNVDCIVDWVEFWMASRPVDSSDQKDKDEWEEEKRSWEEDEGWKKEYEEDWKKKHQRDEHDDCEDEHDEHGHGGGGHDHHRRLGHDNHCDHPARGGGPPPAGFIILIVVLVLVGVGIVATMCYRRGKIRGGMQSSGVSTNATPIETVAATPVAQPLQAIPAV